MTGGAESPQTFDLQTLHRQLAGALAYVAVRDAQGDEHIGTAFHIGDGVFVTARHVLEEQTIIEVATTARAEVVIQAANSGAGSIHYVEPRVLHLARGPYFHPDSNVDVAVFQVSGNDARMPRVPLGHHFEIDIEDHSFVLTNALILGYPPIPNTTVPRLVAARAEVNVVIDTRHAPYAHFIVSATARGGFSGGPAISEFGYALGVVTDSFVRDQAPPELGFMTILSVEPIYSCLAEHFDTLADEVQSWSYVKMCTQTNYLSEERVARLNPRLASASISVYDDDHDVFLELTCPVSESLANMFSAVHSVTPCEIVEEQSGPGRLFLLPRDNPSSQVLTEAARAAAEAARDHGYVLVRTSDSSGSSGPSLMAPDAC